MKLKTTPLNYYAFIIDKLNRIANYEIERDYPKALHIALSLTKFLPKKLKDRLQEQNKRINQRLSRIGATGYFENTMQRGLTTKIYRIAAEEEPIFVDQITSLLDEAHLLTQGHGVPTRARGMGDFQRTVDTARYEAET
jgi:hypothetical protein